MDISPSHSNSELSEISQNFSHKAYCSHKAPLLTLLYNDATNHWWLPCGCYDDFMRSLSEDQRKKLLKSIKPVKTYKYFMTWTTKPECSFEMVLEKFNYFIHESIFADEITLLWYADEHVDTNVHRHVYIEMHKPLMQRNIKCYAKYGHIDHRVAKANQQQIHDYLQKENEITKLI